MKILYGIQCTGNGHITRSIDLISELKKHVEVDVLTSGRHSEVKLPFPIKYPMKGLSYFFGKNGGFDVMRTLTGNNILHFLREISRVPAKEYNLIISDFEPVSAWSARKSMVYSVALSNQASLTYREVPKPASPHILSRWFLRSFCPSTKKYGLFYRKYNQSLFYPPIRQEIKDLKANTRKMDFYVVYLPFYGDERIINTLSSFPDTRWKVFSKHAQNRQSLGHIEILPIAQQEFLESIRDCTGVICSAGFGTTSEALYLGKKLLVIPMKNQYEQLCNAHALSQYGVPSIKSLNTDTLDKIDSWINSSVIPEIEFEDENRKIVHKILTDYIQHFETTGS